MPNKVRSDSHAQLLLLSSSARDRQQNIVIVETAPKKAQAKISQNQIAWLILKKPATDPTAPKARELNPIMAQELEPGTFIPILKESRSTEWTANCL